MRSVSVGQSSGAPKGLLTNPLVADDDPDAGRRTGSAARDAHLAVQQLFTAHYLDLVRLAAAILRETSWSEDVVQDAFAQVQIRWPRIRDEDSGLAYLRKAVLNGARSELRRRGVRNTHGAAFPIDGEPVPTAEAAAVARLHRSELLTAIAELPNRQRNVLLLRFVQDLSIAETARTLRITTGAVKSSQHRAVQNLQKRIEEAP